jgi:hypothetical protein
MTAGRKRLIVCSVQPRVINQIRQRIGIVTAARRDLHGERGESALRSFGKSSFTVMSLPVPLCFDATGRTLPIWNEFLDAVFVGGISLLHRVSIFPPRPVTFCFTSPLAN